MSAPRPTVLPLLLVLLTTPPTPAQLLPEEWDTSGARHLELTAENADEKHPVRVSPRQSTNLVFNAPLLPGGVTVEDERLVKLAVNEALGMVMLLPSGAPSPDRPLTVTVRFADGLVPESVTFHLVVHATRAEHQVQVYRQPRSCESHRQEARQQRERAERCEAALEQERPSPEGPRPGGLSELFDAGLVGKSKAIVGRTLKRGVDFTQRPGEKLNVKEAYSYHAERPGQVAVELHVENPGKLPWTAEGVEGAELVSTEGVRLRLLRVWQPKPIEPGAQRQIVVVAEATVKQVQGTFLLQLGEAGGARAITVRGVIFPY
jgi:uncharacterized protein (TIGR02268 family)